MAKPWDDTLKKLIHLDPPAFVAFLVPQARFIQEWLARSFQKMHDILRDTPIYQMILQEGLEEGLEKGIEKGRKESIEFERMGLLNLVEARFPPLKKLAKEQSAQIESSQVLVDLTVKIALTQSLEEAIDYLVNWKTIYKDQLQ